MAQRTSSPVRIASLWDFQRVGLFLSYRHGLSRWLASRLNHNTVDYFLTVGSTIPSRAELNEKITFPSSSLTANASIRDWTPSNWPFPKRNSERECHRRPGQSAPISESFHNHKGAQQESRCG